jgi:glycosyltransferase involved in cell wall biosynthesis
VICVSNFVRNEILSLGLSHKKIITIHNGVDTRRCYQGPEVSNLQHKFGGRPIILSVGHLLREPIKGYDITIRAFEAILREDASCQAVLVLVGDGPGRKGLEDLVAKLGIGSRVYFEGATKPEVTMQYMAACDLFCLPSWYEAFGIVYLEAMMHGKPIIGVRGQGISEVVEDGVTGLLVPPRDVSSTILAMKSLLSDEQLRMGIGGRAKELVHLRYSLHVAAQKTIDLYREVLYAKVVTRLKTIDSACEGKKRFR